jgi:hypothetical protein
MTLLANLAQPPRARSVVLVAPIKIAGSERPASILRLGWCSAPCRPGAAPGCLGRITTGPELAGMATSDRRAVVPEAERSTGPRWLPARFGEPKAAVSRRSGLATSR